MSSSDHAPQRSGHRPRLRLGHAGRGSRDRRIAVVGLGRFGSSLATELMRRGWDVLGLDTDEGRVQRHGELLTHTAEADCTDSETLRLEVGRTLDVDAVMHLASYAQAVISGVWDDECYVLCWSPTGSAATTP